jgi:hypothetical protein
MHPSALIGRPRFYSHTSPASLVATAQTVDSLVIKGDASAVVAYLAPDVPSICRDSLPLLVSAISSMVGNATFTVSNPVISGSTGTVHEVQHSPNIPGSNSQGALFTSIWSYQLVGSHWLLNIRRLETGATAACERYQSAGDQPYRRTSQEDATRRNVHAARTNGQTTTSRPTGRETKYLVNPGVEGGT